MECKNCRLEKLSDEFPPTPLTPDCYHVTMHCLECTNRKLKKTTQCPDCGTSVSQDRVKELAYLEDIWVEPERNVPVQKLSDQGSRQIFIRQLDGSTTKIHFLERSSISDLKMSIEKYTDIPASCQRLLFQGKEIEDTKNGKSLNLVDFGITSNTTIYLISLFGSVFEEQVHFCIDMSFSMDNKFIIGNKLISRMDCVKEELTKMITNFRHDKKFNLYAFGSKVINWSNTLQPCTPTNRQSALDWVKLLDPSGSTALGEALEAVIACDPAAKTIYVLSDGSPNSESKVLDWIQLHPKVIINATCFLGNSILEEFMQSLAASTKGTYRVFSTELLEKKL